MSDTIVSVRMPKRLFEDIKELTSEKRFLDTSEAIRSVVRKRWTEATQIGTSRIEAFKDELVIEKHDRKRKEIAKQIQKLTEELKKMGDEFESLR